MKKLACMIAGRITKQQELFIQKLGDNLQFKLQLNFLINQCSMIYKGF